MAICAVGAACGTTASDAFVADLRERTKPDIGRISEYFGVSRTSTGIESTWVVEADMPWAECARWVTGRLVPSFDAGFFGASSLTFRKTLEADSYTVVVEDLSTEGRHRFRVAVQGKPF